MGDHRILTGLVDADDGGAAGSSGFVSNWVSDDDDDEKTETSQKTAVKVGVLCMEC